MNATQTAKMYEQIKRHGENLIRLFPDARDKDPVAICKALRRWEGQANRIACDWCNGIIDEDQYDTLSNRIIRSVNTYLGTSRVWFNSDPRGYSLKIDLADGEDLHKDWGGYGIIAPDFTPND